MLNTEFKVKIIEVSPDNKEVKELINKLDKFQISLYGIEYCNLDSIEELKENKAYILGAYVDETLVGIGAVKLFETYGELKRMFLEEAYRGKGIAEKIIWKLENHIEKMGLKKIYLETGYLQKSALNFYKKLGYYEVEQFGSYKPNQVSIYLLKEV